MSDEITFRIPDTVASLDAVPEKFRSLYVEKDGAFAYQDPAVLARALANAKRERDEARKAAAAGEAYRRLGKTPDELEALIHAQAEAEEARVRKAGDWDAYRARLAQEHDRKVQSLVAEHARAVEAKDAALARMKATLEARLVDAEATRAITELKGVPGLLLPHVQRNVKVVEEDGEYRAVVTDARGEPRVNARGEYVSIKDLVAEMRDSDVFARAFDASGVGGGGAPPNSRSAGGGRTISRSQFEALAPAERMAQMRAGVRVSD